MANDDEVCIPSLYNILLAVLKLFAINKPGRLRFKEMIRPAYSLCHALSMLEYLFTKQSDSWSGRSKPRFDNQLFANSERAKNKHGSAKKCICLCNLPKNLYQSSYFDQTCRI